MSATTQIQWTQSTYNPIVGCSPVSVGCKECFAARDAWRMAHNPHPTIAASRAGTAKKTPDGVRWTGLVRCLPEVLDVPLHWAKPRKVFVCSQSDLFHAEVPQDFIAQVFAVMSLAPRHSFQLLTKRAARMAALLSDPAFREQVRTIARQRGSDRRITPSTAWPLPHVWAGASVCTQDDAERQIPPLLGTPAAVRWISAEPLLGAIDLRRIALREDPGYVLDALTGQVLLWPNRPSPRPRGGTIRPLDWVVAGGEAGPRARPMHPDWARSLRTQCVASNVPYFFKSWGDWRPEPTPFATFRRREDAGRIVRWGESKVHTVAIPMDANDDAGTCELLERVGKKAAGRELDGKTWDGFPEVTRG